MRGLTSFTLVAALAGAAFAEELKDAAHLRAGDVPPLAVYILCELPFGELHAQEERVACVPPDSEDELAAAQDGPRGVFPGKGLRAAGGTPVKQNMGENVPFEPVLCATAEAAPLQSPS